LQNLQQGVKNYIRSCITYVIAKPTIKKYTPFPTPDRPSESISMDYMIGLPSTKHGNGCVFVVIDHFFKMVIFTPCKKAFIAKAISKLLFKQVWVHFGLPQSIISFWDINFLSTFWSNLWSLMDTKLTKSTAFHLQSDGQIKVANRMIVHILRMHNSKHPCTWDESLLYIHHIHNITLHNSFGHNPFKVCLGFHPLAPIDVALPISSTRNLPMLKLRLTRQQYFLNRFNTSTNNSMTFWRQPIPSTSNDMNNIGFHTSFRWAIRFRLYL